MTAKSKRPFYVFAAVALLCCMVVVSGVRDSRADDGRSPFLAGPRILERAPTLVPSTDAPGAVSHDDDPGATGGPGPGAPDPSTPDLGRSPVEVELEGPDAPEVPESGIGILAPPDFAAPPGAGDPEVTPPDADDEPTRARGQKKGKGKGKHGQDGPHGPEAPDDPQGTPATPDTQSENVEVEPDAETEDTP